MPRISTVRSTTAVNAKPTLSTISKQRPQTSHASMPLAVLKKLNFSIKLNCRGTHIDIHSSTLLLPLVPIASIRLVQDPITDYFTHLGYVAAAFASVVLHELGHVLAIRLCSLKTHEIFFSMISGHVTQEYPRTPQQRLAIASAGPVTNLLLGCDSFGLWASMNDRPFSHFFTIAIFNLSLSLTCMLPIPNTDGGNMRQALLSIIRNSKK